jgi:hypothetical protein
MSKIVHPLRRSWKAKEGEKSLLISGTEIQAVLTEHSFSI